jgi:hypothetical protein
MPQLHRRGNPFRPGALEGSIAGHDCSRTPHLGMKTRRR